MPRELFEDRFGGRTFEVAIYRNEDLDDRRGNIPEIVVANYVSEALTGIGVNHRVLYDFQPVPVNNNNNGCPGPNKTVAYDVWGPYVRNNAPFVAKDTNILINDAGGGGCGSVGGNVCVGPGRDINKIIFPEDRLVGHINNDAQRQWDFAVYSCLHEIGHNMGFNHEPNPGLAFTDDNNLRNKTPTIGSDDTTNMCGEPNPPDPDPREGDIPHLYYHDCVAEHMSIKNDGGRVFLSTLVADPKPSIVGDTVTVTGALTNTTSSAVSRDFPVTVDGREIGVLQFDAPRNGRDTDSVQFIADEAGDFEVQAGPLVDRLEISRSPGDIEIKNVRLATTPLVVGSQNQIVVTAENTGGLPTQESFNLNVDGEPIDVLEFSLNPGQRQSVIVNWTPEDVKTYHVEVGGVSRNFIAQGGSGTLFRSGVPVLAAAAVGGAAIAIFAARGVRK